MCIRDSIKDVSHELRTPLARVQLALAIAQQKDDGKIAEELNKIKTSADYLNEIISDILAMPVGNQEDWALDDVIELNALLQGVCEDHRLDADNKKITLKFDSAIDEALVETRGNTLVGVFSNLIRNAIHYSPEGTQVSIHLTQHQQQLCIEVSDQGSGVPTEQLEDIFKPFYRTSEARDRTSGGYGLGLAIVQRTVQLHQGSIAAHNLGNNPLNPEGLSVKVQLNQVEFD